MAVESGEILKKYVGALSGPLRGEYAIGENFYEGFDVKRGLRNADGTGVMAGVSKIGSVQGYYIEDGVKVPQQGRLYYRGIDVADIVAAHRASDTFGYEEVAYLLLCGSLPNETQASLFGAALAEARALPAGFFEDVIFKSPCTNIMNGLGRSVLALYAYDENPDDTSVENVLLQSVRLVARFPTIVADLFAVKRHYFSGESLYIHNPKANLSVAENFLRLLRRDKTYTDREAKLLDALLMLHAEHSGGNNSAFTCRSVSSTGSDTYSAISAAVGSLKGPLHGGANAKVMSMIRDIRENVSDVHDDEAMSAYLDKLLDGEAGDRSGKLYGLGHAVYTISDPRAVLLKKLIEEMAQEKGVPEDFEIAQSVERLGIPKIRERKHMTLPISANVDLYSGIVYSILGIPEDLYTPLFAIARISGWCAHRIEEIVTGGRIMRPAYRSAAEHRAYVPMPERK